MLLLFSFSICDNGGKLVFLHDNMRAPFVGTHVILSFHIILYLFFIS